MERYEKYKDSGIEWIGEIPEHWEVNRIRQIAEIFGRIGYRGYKTSDLVPEGSGAITISPSNMKEFHMEFEECTFLSWAKYEESPEIQVFKGDLLFVKTGSTYGKCSIVPELPEKATINPQIIVFKNILCDNVYLWYSLKSNITDFQVQTTVVGGTIPTISQEKIKNYFIVLPQSKNEQTNIATFLDRKTTEIDCIIANKQKLIALYQEEKQAIINQAVTKGLDSKVTLKDSGIEWIGKIPEHWKTKKIKYIGKFINGYSFDSKDFIPSGVRVIKISNIQNMRIDWSDESFVDEELYEKYSAFRIFRDDLIFALTRPIISTGIKATIVDCDDKMLLNQRNSVLRTDKNHINIKWLYYIILNQKFIQEFDSRIDKTGQQPNISSNDIADITIPIPKIEEQKNIIELIESECSRLDSIMQKFNKQIDLLIEYRTTLISEVVTGKIKVPNTI